MPLHDLTVTDTAGGHVRLVHDFQAHTTITPACPAIALAGVEQINCNRHRHTDPHHAGILEVVAGGDADNPPFIVRAILAWEAS
jgi:hypothetical protein